MAARPLARRALLQAGAAAAIGAAGCAGPEGGTRQLNVWSMWTGQEELNFERVLALYERRHPGVRMHNLGAVGDDTKTIRALVAGVPPDIFTLSDPSYLGPLARNGALMPLDELFARSGLRTDQFVPASLDLCRYRGRLYGIPFLIDDLALLWNQRHFADAGLDPDRPPTTLEDLADAAVRLTTHDADGTITRLGLRPLDDLYAVFALFGGRLVDEAGRITADDPGNVAGVEWYADLIRRMGGIEKVRTFVSGFGRDQGASNPFFVGKVSMMFGGEWNPYWASRYAPDMRFEVAPVPAPRSRPDRARTTWVGGNVFCLPAECRKAEEAWRFLVWTQGAEPQEMYAHDMNNVPNQRSVLRSPRLRTGPSFRRKFATFLDLANSPNAGFFPALPVASLYMNQVSNALDRILYGDMDARTGLAAVRRRVQAEMDRS